MKRIFPRILLFCALVVSTALYGGAGYDMLVYADGSGNVYHYSVTANVLEYFPVQPENSSSGIYSGGEYKKIRLNKKETGKLLRIFIKALSAKGEHFSRREKGTGQLELRKNQNTETVILKSSSRMKNEIEQFLKSILHR